MKAINFRLENFQPVCDTLAASARLLLAVEESDPALITDDVVDQAAELRKAFEDMHVHVPEPRR